MKFRHKKGKLGINKKSSPCKNERKGRTDHRHKPPFYKNHPHSVYHLHCTPVARRPASYYKNQAIKNKDRQNKLYQATHVDTKWWKPTRSLPSLDPDLQTVLNALPLLKPYQTITKTWDLSVLNSPMLGPFRDKFKRGYEGQFNKTRFHGWGVFVRDQGRFLYEGEFFEGKEDGWGRQVASNGEVLEGQWEKGHFMGDRNEFNFESKTVL